MPTSTVEDYLKAILIQEQRLGDKDLVTMGQIANALGVAPGTVTSMVKTLSRGGHLSYEPYSGVRLTAKGRRLGMHMLRRHRLIECFLVDVLGLDWSEVHDEAERLEHAMSDKLIDRIDALLGYPSRDPHGDPIPDEHGKIRETELVSLAECTTDSARLARVSDQDESFLRFAKRHGLEPGARLRLLMRDPVAGAITVAADDEPAVTLGIEVAAKLQVEPQPPESPKPEPIEAEPRPVKES